MKYIFFVNMCECLDIVTVLIRVFIHFNKERMHTID